PYRRRAAGRGRPGRAGACARSAGLGGCGVLPDGQREHWRRPCGGVGVECPMSDAISHAPNERAIAALQAATGHTFVNPQLPLDALTHRSYAYESTAPGVRHNERLEFLGDAVLQLICSDLLFR